MSASPPTRAAPSIDWGDVDFDRLEGGLIHFRAKAGKTAPPALQTNLFELAYQGTIRGDTSVPSYFVFTGKSCDNCPEEKAVYIVRGTGGRVDRFVFPGKIIDPKTRAPLVETRAFVGKCLHRVPGEVYVVFQKERIDRRRYLQASLFVARPGESHLDEKLIERRLPNIAETLRWVKGKKCHEIEGRNRLMLSKPINLRPNKPDEDEDDDEPVPEKPTTAASDNSEGPAAPTLPEGGATPKQ